MPLLSLLCAGSIAAAQHGATPAAVARGAIDGAVTDSGLVALGETTVSLLGTGVHVVTGANGRFRIAALAAGNYILVVHRLGYVPVSTSIHVEPLDTLRLSVALTRVVNVLDTVAVRSTQLTTRMSEFETRRSSGIGHFITRDEIERRNSRVTQELLRSMPGVRVEEKRFRAIAYNMHAMGQCPYDVYVDGILMPPPVNVNDLPIPHDIAGIEQYAGGATLPLQYKSTQSNCGAILIWTRDGD